jgi:AP-3 complex subunit delta-1
LDGLANIVTPDLARDLSKDLYAILNHSRANVRKRAVLVLYKLFLRFPETLEQNFVRLKEKLEDPDPGAVSRQRSQIFFRAFVQV